MSGIITDALEILLFPPGGMLFLILLGLLLLPIVRRMGVMLILGGTLLLYVFSMPVVSNQLLAIIEPPTSLSQAQLDTPSAQAIVILGGGRREDASDIYFAHNTGDTLSNSTLERVRYGAWLAKRMNLPVLVTGGLADEDGATEGELMKEVLEDEFGIAVHWTESQSRTTYENALYSSEMLAREGIQKIYLVTHALHMPRSVWSFRQFGLEVYAAPTAYKGGQEHKTTVYSFLPSAHAMQKVNEVLHEVVGMLWYRLRH